MLDLREDLAVLGADVGTGVHPDALKTWGTAPPLLDRRCRAASSWRSLSILAIAAAIGWLAFDLGYYPLLLMASAEGVYALWHRDRVQKVLAGVDRATQDLELLAEVLTRIEQQPLAASRLSELQTRSGPKVSSLRAASPSSSRLLNLARRAAQPVLHADRTPDAVEHAAGVRHRPLARVSGPGDRRAGSPSWASSRRCAAWPATLRESGRSVSPRSSREVRSTTAHGLGHPLMPRRMRAQRRLRLGRDVAASTSSAARTCRARARCCATVGDQRRAGAGRRAGARGELRLSPLIGAEPRCASRIRCKRASRASTPRSPACGRSSIWPAARIPLLFLLDEILHGTNSHDRRIGAEAIVRGLDRSAARSGW